MQSDNETHPEVHPCAPQRVIQRRNIRRVHPRLLTLLRRLRCGPDHRRGSDDWLRCRGRGLCLRRRRLGSWLVCLLSVLWIVAIRRLGVVTILIVRVWCGSVEGINTQSQRHGTTLRFTSSVVVLATAAAARGRSVFLGDFNGMSCSSQEYTHGLFGATVQQKMLWWLVVLVDCPPPS